MKTVGEILKAGRQAKGLTLEKLSDLTKIDAIYIEALEENQFTKLPSSTFTKGFIRNLSKALDKNPDELIAVYRRDYNGGQEGVAKPKSRHQTSFSSLFHSQLTLLVVGLATFVVYLIFQYRAVITPPKLEIENPKPDAVVVSPVSISGQTSPGSTVIINDNLRALPDNNGNFSAKLNLSSGQNEINIKASNRFSNVTTKTINITVLSQ